MINTFKIIDGFQIYANGMLFITIRGWGRLTGCGNGLCLHADKAREIQNNLAKWIVDKLTK